jgi:hypothetical protein
MIRYKIPVSFLFREMTRTAKQAEFRRNSGPLRLVFVFREITFLLEIGNPSFGRWMNLNSQKRAFGRDKFTCLNITKIISSGCVFIQYNFDVISSICYYNAMCSMHSLVLRQTMTSDRFFHHGCLK